MQASKIILGFYLEEKPGEPPPTLFEYFPDNAIIFVDESHVTVPQLKWNV